MGVEPGRVPEPELGETVRAALEERARIAELARRRAEGAKLARTYSELLVGQKGVRTCPLHGDYSFLHAQCPVCVGRSTGRTWSNIVGRMLDESYFDKVERRQHTGHRPPSGPAEGDWNVRGWGG
jgi:hypothetical protein